MYLDRFRLEGRVAVVTGGAQAIGLACVEALSEAGAHVYIADRNPAAAAEGRAAIAAKGYKADFIEMDVTNSAQVDAAAAQVLQDKGRVDILVCNAGIARSETPAEALTDGLLASPCSRRGVGRSSISARCPAISSTSLSRRRNTMPRKPACII